MSFPYTCSGLVMIQTTNGIFNKTLYDLSTPKALLAWHRVRLANWLASSGEEWANYVSQYNSGTCIHAQKIIIMVNMHGMIHVHVLTLTVNTSVLAHTTQEPTTISTWCWT